MKNKKYFLLITSSYPGSGENMHSGAGVFVKNFACELAKKANVIVLTQQTVKGEPASTCESDMQIIRFPWAGHGKPLSTLRLPEDIRLILSVIFNGFWASFKIGKQYEVEHTMALWAIPSGLWALSLKWIYGIRYSAWCLGSDIWNYKKNFFTRSLLRLIFREADFLYADGYELKSDVELISRKPCDFLSSSRTLPDQVQIKTDIRQGKKNYLFIGRYHPNKGPDLLLEAVTKLSPLVRENVHFHLFGGGYLKPLLREYIENNHIGDVVTLNDYIDEYRAVAYLKACDALIIPSRIESIPVVLSDALKTDSAIIAADVGDMGYLLKKYQGGIVVHPESAEKLAKAIEDALSEKRDKFRKGRKELLELFDISKTVQKFISDQDSCAKSVNTAGSS